MRWEAALTWWVWPAKHATTLPTCCTIRITCDHTPCALRVLEASSMDWHTARCNRRPRLVPAFTGHMSHAVCSLVRDSKGCRHQGAYNQEEPGTQQHTLHQVTLRSQSAYLLVGPCQGGARARVRVQRLVRKHDHALPLLLRICQLPLPRFNVQVSVQLGMQIDKRHQGKNREDAG